MPEAVLIAGRPARERRAPFAGSLVAIPVRTPLVDRGDDLATLVAKATSGIASANDVICVSETAVAIAQGRLISAETIRPSRLAYVLSRHAGAMATVSQPESLQLVIDEVGPWKVAYAAAAQVAGRLVGKRGMFYEILGEAIAAIDGYTGTMPPFERTIVLGPEDPDGAAQSIAARSGSYVAIVDVNDLSIAKVLGASRGVVRARVEGALLGNPHGNADEQTPIVVLKWRGAGANPMLEAAA
jgi:F420-0:gamma-glutamyl ligase